ncbi:MAG: T9SS type A sorting domain-containing protein [Bacteroidota bacterium]|nr:T9SS type A sorting domain-containing protein [Bacteroidota bacterium]MDP3144217.1 T9SS type A sorting domain-containing protein [Bacteroidota bacterium]
MQKYTLKTLRLMLVVICFLLIKNTFSTTYYVSSSMGNNVNNGASALMPWKTISKVNSITFLPGDSVLFKKGDVWKGTNNLFFTESGTASNPIVISSYGTGTKPVISDILPLIGSTVTGNWTNTSTNIWKMKYLPGTSPNRLWLNGTEVLVSVILADVGTTNSQGTFEKWFYNSIDSSLYVHATGNPATTYSAIEGNSPSGVFALYGSAYVIVDDLDFRGGRWSTVYLGAASYCSIKNCNIGYGLTGISATSSSSVSATHHVTIENNTFDSGFNFLYGMSSTLTDGALNRGSEDGITMSFAVNNCIIRNNIFNGWGHAAINGYCKDNAFSGIHDNKIYSNTFTGNNNSYNRAIGLDGFEGKNYNNEFYYNLMKNHKVRSQVNGNNNWVHHNIFDGQTTSPARNYSTDGAGQAIEMSVYGLGLVSHDNKIDNNLFINTTEAALVFRSYGGYPDKSTNHLIRNNIFYNTGYKTALAADSGLAIKLTTTVEAFNNTFQNNCIYNPGKPITSAIKYYGTLQSVVQFNSQNGNAGNIITNNIQMDPLFINYINDFHLQVTSPCIDSGIVITGLTNDLDGNPIFSGITSDIGPYEFISGVGITNYFLSKQQLLVYPNPSNGQFTIEVQKTENILVKIYNMLGEKIFENQSDNSKIKVNLSTGAGIYFFEVKTQQKIIGNGKIVIQ